MSNYLYTVLSDNGFSPDYQGLVPSDSAQFPQNIIITIQADGTAARAFDQEQTVLACTQEYVLADTDGFVRFVRELKREGTAHPLTILISANDGPSALPRDTARLHPGGTEVFTSQLGITDTICVIVIEEAGDGAPTIIPGGARDISPLWLVQTLEEACSQAQVAVTVPGFVSFLYRLGLVDENTRVSTFLRQGIPAAGITLGHSEADYAALRASVRLLGQTDRHIWDRHYAHVTIPFPRLEFWFSETYYAFAYLLLAAGILFMLSFSSFAQTGRNIAVIKDLIRSWYLIPLLVATTSAVLVLSQAFLVPYLDSPLLLLGGKILTAFFLSLLIFIVQGMTQFKLAYKASAYKMLFVAAGNIFLFCAIDISFLFLFFCEYLLCQLAKKARRPPAVALTLALMVIPFVPVIAHIVATANQSGLRTLAASGIVGNVLLALILYPFQSQWQRLLASLDLFDAQRARARLRTFFAVSLFTILSLALLAAFYLVLSHFLSSAGLIRRHEAEEASAPPVALSQTRTSVRVSEDSFMELLIRHISIEHEEPVLRYEVSIETEDDVPLFDSNYPYLFSGSRTVSFLLPDYPAAHIDITYTCKPDDRAAITVVTYSAGEDGSVTVERGTTTVGAE